MIIHHSIQFESFFLETLLVFIHLLQHSLFSESNGTQAQENKPGYLRKKDAELYPLANSLVVSSTGSDSQPVG